MEAISSSPRCRLERKSEIRGDSDDVVVVDDVEERDLRDSSKDCDEDVAVGHDVGRNVAIGRNWEEAESWIIKKKKFVIARA